MHNCRQISKTVHFTTIMHNCSSNGTIMHNCCEMNSFTRLFKKEATISKIVNGTGLGLVNRYSGSVILVSSRAVNRLTDVNIN